MSMDFEIEWHSYFGARYYDPNISIWLSVDPLSDEYPSLSPYNYCASNPIMFYDPDGKDAIPIVFPKYKISAYGRKWSHIGHAGVLLIDNKTGYTKYYEYGRYKSDQGEVRSYPVPNVVMGEDGMPTKESLNKVLKTISEVSGQGGSIEGAYIKSDEFDKMNNYAKEKLSDNENPERESYSIWNNNCGTFMEDVVKQDGEVKDQTPNTIDPRPNSKIEEYRRKFDKVDYDSDKGATITPIEE